MRILCFLFALVPCIAFSQKQIEFKKGGVFLNDQRVADYDNKGGQLSASRRLWLVNPNTSDTLMTIQQVFYHFKNPLFLDDIFYYVNVKDAANTKYYASNMPEYQIVAQATEKQILGRLMNDKIGLPFTNGKPDEAGVQRMIASTGYNLDSILQLLNEVKDSIKSHKLVLASRDVTGDITYSGALNKNIIPRFIIRGPEMSNKYWIFQGGVKIGLLEKIPEPSRGIGYAFYKIISPITIASRTLSVLPVATAFMSEPFGNSPAEPAVIKMCDGSPDYKIQPLPHNAAETGIIKALVHKGMM